MICIPSKIGFNQVRSFSQVGMRDGEGADTLTRNPMQASQITRL